MSLPSAPEAGGRAWLPSSTGLPGDRAPSRAEVREVWLRQARGVYEATRSARSAAAAHKQAAFVVAALFLIGGLGLMAAIVLLPPASTPAILIAVHVIAGAFLLLAQLAAPAVMSADAIAEVSAKSSQAWASSPLSTSAWIAGKVAYYLHVHAGALLRFLPFAAASSMLGGIRLREVLAIVLVGLAWTFVAGVGVAAASLEARQSLAQRLAARRGVLGPRFGQGAAFRGNTPPAAGFAVMQIALGVAGVFMVLPFAVSGLAISSAPPPVLLMVGAFCALSPVAASASAFFPQFAVPVLGVAVPLWMISILVALAVGPRVVATSRLLWRPPDGATGMAVRPASWFAWTVLALLAAMTLRASPVSYAVACCFVPAAGVVAALAAGGSRLPDLAAGRVAGWRLVAGLDRRTAAWHGMAVATLVALVFAAAAPAGVFTRLPALVVMLVLAAAALPLVLLAGALGREGRRSVAKLEAGSKAKTSRPAGFVLLALLLAAFAPVGAAILRSLGEAGWAAMLDTIAVASPVATVVGIARDVLGIALPSGSGQGPLPVPMPAWTAVAAGLAVQLALALLAVRLERRSAAKDEPLPPPA